MEESLRMRLGIKPGYKVCLFHARKDILPSFMQGDLNLMLDWAEDGCDAILYWIQEKDNMGEIMTRLESQIKRSGRICLVYKKIDDQSRNKEKESNLKSIRQIVQENTNLIYCGILPLGENEYAEQYMFPKAARNEPARNKF